MVDAPGPESRLREGEATAARAEQVGRRNAHVVERDDPVAAVSAVVERVKHKKYDKFVLRTKKLYAHDEANDVQVGDRVRVMEIRPMSKLKRWRITDVLERAK